MGGVSWTPPQPPERLLHWLPPTLRTHDHTPTTGCGKAPRGLLAPRGVPGLCTRLRVHRIPGRDSGDLVGPFMHAGTYPARHLATLRESELLPAFSGASPGWTRVSRTASGQDSAPVHTLTGSRGPMFLLNSRVPLVTATCGPRVLPKTAGTPSTEGTGPICRVPWPGLTPIRLGLLIQGTCVGSRYGRGGSFPTPFSLALGIDRTHPNGRAPPAFSRFSP